MSTTQPPVTDTTHAEHQTTKMHVYHSSPAALQTTHGNTQSHNVTAEHLSKDVTGGHPTTVHQVVTNKEIPATPGKTQETSVHHSTDVTGGHTTSVHPVVTKKEIPFTPGKIQETSVHHARNVTGGDSTSAHPVVTKKEIPSTPGKSQETLGFISVPDIRIESIHNIFHIRCISERGPHVIHYELIQGDIVVKSMTVEGREAALFKWNITQGSSNLYCRARTPSGEEKLSQPLRIVGDTRESEDKPGDKAKPDKEEREARPEFLISLTHILTSVSQPVQDLNAIIISVCGPVILVLILLILIIHFCNRRGSKIGSTVLSSAA
ncbi:uncharacterized protein [Pyxicephalus adspersus]